jgi:hypothetical protein
MFVEFHILYGLPLGSVHGNVMVGCVHGGIQFCDAYFLALIVGLE